MRIKEDSAMLPSVHEPIVDFHPPHYVCRRTRIPLGEPDGRLDKPFWEQAPWTSPFHDIEGDSRPAPAKLVQAKLLWDDEALYIGAYLQEDAIWATVTQRDHVIFEDNDFEVFLAPQDSTHRYYELEMNALNTVWDLLMEKPARDGVRRIIGWDIHGLKSAVYIEGKLNCPAANNRFWSLELVIPWFSLRECGENECYPARLAPEDGEIWRMNFSRVEWTVDVVDGQYRKRLDPATGRPLPEANWVWAPTGVIDIHMPELWGYLLFTQDDERTFSLPEDEAIKWQLRRLYYRERNYGAAHGHYTTSLKALLGEETLSITPRIDVTPNLFEISAPASHGTLHIRQDGYLWREP